MAAFKVKRNSNTQGEKERQPSRLNGTQVAAESFKLAIQVGLESSQCNCVSGRLTASAAAKAQVMISIHPSVTRFTLKPDRTSGPRRGPCRAPPRTYLRSTSYGNSVVMYRRTLRVSTPQSSSLDWRKTRHSADDTAHS